jgi:hypothetical protein
MTPPMTPDRLVDRQPVDDGLEVRVGSKGPF